MNVKINAQMILGPALVLLGAYLLLNPGGVLSPGSMIGYFWPSMFVIPVSILFHWMYFSLTKRKGIGLLIPAGILFTVGIVCQISMLFGNWEFMWPGFVLAPAVGLLEFYVFGYRNKWILLPVAILTTLSLMFFTVFSLGSIFNHVVAGQPIIAIALILAGAFTLIRRKDRRY